MGQSILIVSDAHLTVGSKQYDAEFALEQAGEIALDRRVSMVIAAGDTIDKQRNRSRPITQAYRFIDKLVRKKIRFGFIDGNHDMDDPPWFVGIDRAEHLHRATVEVDGLRIYGLSFLPRGVLQQELDRIPEETDILVAHQVWANWMGDIAAPQGEFADIPLVKTVVTGDFHQFMLEKNIRGKDGQKMTVCSPGCTYQKTVAEPSQHYVVLIGDDGKITPVKLRSRVFYDWPKIITEEDLEAFVKGFDGRLEKLRDEAAERELPERLRRPMMRVTYMARLGDALRRIERTVQGRVVLHTREIPVEAKAQKVTRAAGKAEIVTPLSVLPDEVDKKEEPEVFNLVSRLLQAPDVKQSLAAWRQEQLND